MLVRQSTLAVALVIALSAAAATTQVFAADEEGEARAAQCSMNAVRHAVKVPHSSAL